MMQYKIKRGDTLSGIAKKFNTTVDTLAFINHIERKDKIKAGAVINIPTGEPRWLTRTRDWLFGPRK